VSPKIRLQAFSKSTLMCDVVIFYGAVIVIYVL
jgi:hypothetical protein